MITPDLIVLPFANTGTVTPPPQSSSSGFVNFTDGYTAFYEIDLSSSNPNKKPMERGVQNYLFQQAGLHAQAWQQLAIPPWYSTMTSGYAKNAMVMRVGSDGTAKPYRSLVAGNLTDPIGSTGSWEYTPTATEMIANIPMPAGGAGGSSTAIITVATNLNTFTSGTWEFQTDAIAQGSANIPSVSGSVAVSGMLESKTWSNGSSTYTVQRYTDRNGYEFVRSAASASFTNWKITLDVASAQSGKINFVALGGAVNVYTATLVPAPGTLIDGFEFRSTVNTTNTGAVTLQLNDGANIARSVVCQTGALQGGELQAAQPVTFRYNLINNNFVLVNAPGNVTTPTATKSNHAVPLGQNATETQVGVAATSTQALATAGVDDTTIITPKKLAGWWAANGLQIPIGMLADFPVGTVPSGWLEADGSQVLIAGYPQLYAYVGTTFNTGSETSGYFRLPDLRGIFKRGWDHGRGVDPSRAISTTQASANAAHAHTGSTAAAGSHLHGLSVSAVGDHQHVSPWGEITPNFSPPWGTYGANNLYGSGQSNSDNSWGYTSPAGGHAHTASMDYGNSSHSHPVTVDASGTNESRPINLSVMTCIRAYATAINQGTIDVAALSQSVAALTATTLGFSQTWQSLIGSRTYNTTYTNTSGRPIAVKITYRVIDSYASTTAFAIAGNVGAIRVDYDQKTGGAGLTVNTGFIVPPNAQYSCSINDTVNLVLLGWSELRA